MAIAILYSTAPLRLTWHASTPSSGIVGDWVSGHSDAWEPDTAKLLHCPPKPPPHVLTMHRRPSTMHSFRGEVRNFGWRGDKHRKREGLLLKSCATSPGHRREVHSRLPKGKPKCVSTKFGFLDHPEVGKKKGGGFGDFLANFYYFDTRSPALDRPDKSRGLVRSLPALGAGHRLRHQRLCSNGQNLSGHNSLFSAHR